jgi:exonuclease SbcD
LAALMIAHLADVHLGAKPYQLEFRRKDVLDSFEEAVDQLLTERPGLVVVAGDFFDTPRPDNDVLIFAVKQLRRLTDHGLRVVFTYGEHDYPRTRDRTPLELVAESVGEKIYAPPRLSFRGSVPVLDNYILELEGLTVYLTPYIKASHETRKKLMKEIMASFENDRKSRAGRKVLVAHLAFETDFPFGAPLSSPRLLPRVDYAAMGHLHKPSICIKECLDNDVTPYAYTGSLEALRRDEIVPEGRGFYLVDLSGDEPGISKVKLESTRPQYVLESTIDRLSYEIELLASKEAASWNKMPLVHVLLHGAKETRVSRSSLSRIVDSLKRKYNIYLRVEYASVRREATSKPEGGVVDPRSILARLIDPYKRHKHSMTIAGLILELKNALIEGSESDVDEVLTKLSGYENILLEGESNRATLDKYW